MSEDWDHLVERAQSRVGSTVSTKWTLDAVLGVGGMATVYAGTHRNGKRGAVKVLHSEIGLNPQVRARFLREGYVANKVDHPGAVSVLDDDVAQDGTVYLVMELLEGEALDVKFASARMTVLEALAAADQILEVLDAAHAKGIVHRDLKPANIFLTREGIIKVLDFGIARLRDAPSNVPNPPTVSRHSMGTPGFMSPEQTRGLWDEVDARTDLWALGATLFTAMAGRLVHEGRTVNELLLAGMTKPAPSLATLLPDAPPSVVALIDRALAFEREARWASAAEMRNAVRAAFVELDARDLPPSAYPLALARRRSVPGPSDGAVAATAPAMTLPGEATRSGVDVQASTLPASDPPKAMVGSATNGEGVPWAEGAPAPPTMQGASLSVAPRKRALAPAIAGAMAVVAAFGAGVVALRGRDEGRATPATAAASPSAPASTSSTPSPLASTRAVPSPAASAPPLAETSPAEEKDGGGVGGARPSAVTSTPRTTRLSNAKVAEGKSPAAALTSASAAVTASAAPPPVDLFLKRH
jgi:serine/threonine-protein kinase